MPALPKYLNKPRLQQDDKQPIVFDLFDTLIDESSVYKEFFSNIAEKYHIKKSEEEFVKQLFKNQNEFVFADSKKSFVVKGLGIQG